jgi:hypothetical protein
LLSDFKKFRSSFLLALLTALGVVVWSSNDSQAQRARFGDFFELSPGTGQQPLINQPLINQPLTAPPTNLTFPQNGPVIGLPNTNAGLPVIQGGVLPPGAVIQNGLPTITTPNFGNPLPNYGSGAVVPNFAPYQTPNQPFPIFPRVTPPANNPPQLIPQPNINPPFIQQPPVIQRQPVVQQPVLPRVQAPQFNRNFQPYGYGSPQVPNRWPYQGTGTNWLPAIDWSWAQRGWNSFRNNFLPRVLERPRFRETYIFGNNGNELGINDFEVATTATLPRFFNGTQPMRVSPGFIASFWDGPETAVTGFDLPSKAMSAYLSFDFISDTSRNFGFDNNLTVGVYSDYNNFSSDALRVTGRLVGWNRINEYMVAKLGVEYFDRVRIKMLPVVGIYATPNPDMKLDLTFPRSKLSHRIPNFNELEAWAYVGAEIGGGSWAIERIDGTDDIADINDTRAFIGLEWMGPRRVTGFLDFGYVFDRELAYKSDPINELEIQDSLMLRSGLAF